VNGLASAGVRQQGCHDRAAAKESKVSMGARTCAFPTAMGVLPSRPPRVDGDRPTPTRSASDGCRLKPLRKNRPVPMRGVPMADAGESLSTGEGGDRATPAGASTQQRPTRMAQQRTAGHGAGRAVLCCCVVVKKGCGHPNTHLLQACPAPTRSRPRGRCWRRGTGPGRTPSSPRQTRSPAARGRWATPRRLYPRGQHKHKQGFTEHSNFIPPNHEGNAPSAANT
jgi:hypothetical protein